MKLLTSDLMQKIGAKKFAPPGNRTRVARMGILHDTTTPAALQYGSANLTYLKLCMNRIRYNPLLQCFLYYYV